MIVQRKTASKSDILTISGNIGHLQFRAEPPDQDSYLNGFIMKPWGHEYRIYCDYLFDIWKLAILPGESTSMHCHVRKDTVLICMSGHGTTSFLTGEAVPVSPGKCVYIGRGVFHRTQADEDGPLDLIEVENPRNKFDLIRIGDDYGRTAKAYEPNASSHENLEPMQSVGQTILHRPRDISGRYEFALQRLDPGFHEDTALRFAVMLDIHHHLAGSILVLPPNAQSFAEHAGSLSFLIREPIPISL